MSVRRLLSHWILPQKSKVITSQEERGREREIEKPCKTKNTNSEFQVMFFLPSGLPKEFTRCCLEKPHVVFKGSQRGQLKLMLYCRGLNLISSHWSGIFSEPACMNTSCSHLSQNKTPLGCLSKDIIFHCYLI